MTHVGSQRTHSKMQKSNMAPLRKIKLDDVDRKLKRRGLNKKWPRCREEKNHH